MKPINPARHGTLEFLAGMLEEDKAQEIVEEASRNYFELKQENSSKKTLPEVLSEMDLAYRIMSDQPFSGKKKSFRLLNEVPHLMNKDYFRSFSEKTQDFMLEYTQRTMPELARSKWKARLVVPLLSVGLGIGGWWYYHDSSKKEETSQMGIKPLPKSEKENYFKQKGELLKRGKKECEELSFSPDLIECYRYYTFDQKGKIVEKGYKDGFRPVKATSHQDYFGNIIQKKTVWKLTPKECFTAYHAGAGKVILELDYNHFWEWEYSNQQEAYDVAQTLERFCKKKIDDLTERDYPEIKTLPLFEKLSRGLAEGRKDCDVITYSPQAMECLKEYLTDEEGNVLKSDYEVFPGPQWLTDGVDEDSWESDLRLVWRINSQECREVYDAGAGVIIMELEGGRVWEFKHYNINPNQKKEVSAEEVERWYQAYLAREEETPYVADAETIIMTLQMFWKRRR
ncbi:MAG: hypothetical protein AABY26_05390 [Nanoarchaeota archaeon]